ncbi:MAG: PAS domain S-box protein [Spirochaetaceae bacterium]|nr:PAS domain S-box protein [Spirochaetaceae bacterium]
MLNESKYLRSLIETSLDPFVTISPEGKITDVNEATIKATGVSRDKLRGTDFGYWEQVEVYIKDHSKVEFTHGLCPECAKKLYPDYS